MSFDRPSASRLRLAFLRDGWGSVRRTGLRADNAAQASACKARRAGRACQQTPAQPASPPAQQGPTVVQVKPEPCQPDWVKVCGKDQGSGRRRSATRHVTSYPIRASLCWLSPSTTSRATRTTWFAS